MGCTTNNATEPSPAIAPGAEDIDPRAVALEVARRWRTGEGMAGRLQRLVPGFDAPFFQAGLAGYSDAAMRIIARRHGCPLCVTEALLDRTLLAGGRGFAKADLGEIEDNVPGGSEDHPLVGQIMGSDPAEMSAAAVKMVEQGRRTDRAYRSMAADGPQRACAEPDSRTFAAIDVNLACPVKKIARKARGGHWLAEPEGAIAILRAVRDAVPAPIPVTIKIRRSFDDTPEMVANFYRILDAAFDLGIAWATVHGRTVRQKYVGPSRWDVLREVVRAYPGCPIFTSGDVWSAEDIYRMLAYTGSCAVSVARGCIGNPWIFRQARQMMDGQEPTPPTVAEQRAVLLEHFELALALHRSMRHAELHTARAMRKFGIRFSAHHPQHEQVRRRMIEVSSLDDWRKVVDDFYRDDPSPSQTADQTRMHEGTIDG